MTSTSLSTIDHFVSNPRVLNAVTEAGVLHNVLNTSNHSPIYVKIDVGQLKVDVEKHKATSRTSWAKSSEDNRLAYSESVRVKLNAVPVFDSLNCTDIHCTVHSDQIENYTLEVVKAIEAAARETILVVGVASPSLRNLLVVYLVGMINDH